MDVHIIRATDCEAFPKLFLFLVHKALGPEDRLEILRAADAQRRWTSLDDRRICTVCNKFITGRQIEIRRDQRGRFLLHCPTQDCISTAQDWFYCGAATSPDESSVLGSVSAA